MHTDTLSAPPSSTETLPRFAIKNPVTGNTIGTLPIFDVAALHEAAARARATQPAWEALGVKRRALLMRAWIDALWAHDKKLVAILRRETGKTYHDAIGELFSADVIAIYYAQNAARILRPYRGTPIFPIIQRVDVEYRAHGVVGMIAPWNYPLLNIAFELIAALVAGNAVLVKPSELTPYTALFIIEMFHRVGVPQEIVQVVTGDATTGAALVDVVNYVHVTGSTATGRKVAVRAAERLIPYSLELGGKAPLIVLKDADLDLAATAALVGGLQNAGQACVAIERVYVEAPIYEEYLERLRHHAAKLKIGTGDGYSIHVGSMEHERELLRAEKQLAAALAKGARLVCGGKRRPDLGPLFFEPTILADVDHTMEIMRDETFGPIIPVMRVRDADEAIALANDSNYGLSSAIYTRDLARGRALARRIQAGDVSINRVLINVTTAGMPSGGVKDSGIGRRNGVPGLLRFVTTHAVMTDKLVFNPPSLSVLDPITRLGAHVMRHLRRWLPFL
jgi:acyl-CoA reductase-like NAD-dependent aldehyde dehydrogenase